MKSIPSKMSYVCKQCGVPLCRRMQVNNRVFLNSRVEFVICFLVFSLKEIFLHYSDGTRV